MSADDWQEARQALDSVAMPLPDVLELRRVQAMTATDPVEAAMLADSVQSLSQRMADTLADWPARREGALARFRPR